MPQPLIKKFAEKTGKSETEVEKLYHKAKGIVEAEYNYTEADEEFYPLVIGVLKKELSITDALIVDSTMRMVLNEQDVQVIKDFLDVSLKQGGTPVRKLLSYMKSTVRALQ